MPSRAVVGIAAFASFLALGSVVAHGAPSPVDLIAVGERARFPALALFLTRAGQFPAYVALCVLALAFGAARRAYLAPAIILVVEIVTVWLAGDLFKAAFHRARPDYFYSIRETSYAYASGHAAISLACFGFIAYVAWRSELNLGIKRGVAIAAGIWVLGIGWSRLALGAHYPSDLLGGYLLATSALAIASAVYDRYVMRTGERLGTAANRTDR
ncbi:MAG: hypothetical protein NVS3B16_09820 [Vulcanimicrobiaceae bacterium]